MDTSKLLSVKSHKSPRGFTNCLASAVLEWTLILMLFIDAIFSYLIKIFARYCELQAPCILCSRLDHVLSNEKPGFCWDVICRNHKLEISSLVLCNIHEKLVDVHGICENCLLSFATKNKSNAETCRLLVGKLGTDIHVNSRPDQDPLLEDHRLGFSIRSHCSCCDNPCIPRGYAGDIFQIKSIESNACDLKIEREKSSGSVRGSQIGKNGFDSLSHIGYTELKITSDTESEVPSSDDDDVTAAIVCEMDEPPRVISLSHDFVSEKLIDPISAPEFEVPVTRREADMVKPDEGSSSLASGVAIGHGLEELNWDQVEQKADPSALISLGDVPPSMVFPIEVIREKGDTETGKIENLSVTETGEISKAVVEQITKTEMGLDINAYSSETGLQIPNFLDLGDAYKLAVGNRGKQLSDLLAEQWTGKDSARVTEDLKFLLSQISANRGCDLSWNETSPRVSVNNDELKASEASSGLTGIHMLQKRVSLERNESGFESLDGSVVSEIEGESIVDRFKRQIEHDRKSMNALYKELEEERNASAVAANQAMAMITRLQEEKAALHMEALQYLRMMEEQAEYDMEALQKANDLLADKEKEIQDLEAELEFYQKNMPDELVSEGVVERTCDKNLERINSIKNGLNVEEFIETKSSSLDFEDERACILRCLKKLEEKLHSFSNCNGDAFVGEFYGKEEEGISDEKDDNYEADQNGESHRDGQGSAVVCPESDLVAIGNEVSGLHDRLEALEMDRDFLEHTINSLKIGDKGLKFVEEIAYHLRELRQIGIRERDHTVG